MEFRIFPRGQNGENNGIEVIEISNISAMQAAFLSQIPVDEVYQTLPCIYCLNDGQ